MSDAALHARGEKAAHRRPGFAEGRGVRQVDDDIDARHGFLDAPAGHEVHACGRADGETVRLPRTPLQPIAAADVSRIIAEVAAGTPLNGVLDIAAPAVYPLDGIGRLTLAAKGDGRSVVTDDTAGMYAAVHGDVLTAGHDARIAPHPLHGLARLNPPRSPTPSSKDCAWCSGRHFDHPYEQLAETIGQTSARCCR